MNRHYCRRLNNKIDVYLLERNGLGCLGSLAHGIHIKLNADIIAQLELIALTTFFGAFLILFYALSFQVVIAPTTGILDKLMPWSCIDPSRIVCRLCVCSRLQQLADSTVI